MAKEKRNNDSRTSRNVAPPGAPTDFRGGGSADPVEKTKKERRNKGRPSGPTPPPAPPGNRQDAAVQNLEAIDALLSRIRDDVQRQALEQERQRVAKELERGDLVLVVFGVGSSGKTSLIRALLNDVVGEVGAAMGSTEACTSYRLRLRGLRRGLRLVDTPGIL
ncbi:hypothetical protein EBT31_10825, partial [bacterium]|nr:hypothetical protein [bacterium]